MRLLDAIKILGAAAIVHVVMTACGGGSSGGTDTPDAWADAPGTYADEPCNKVFQKNGVNYYYAEHAYPGKTARDLARVTAIVHYTAAGMTIPEYTMSNTQTMIRDGFAAVICGQSPLPVERVTFLSDF